MITHNTRLGIGGSSHAIQSYADKGLIVLDLNGYADISAPLFLSVPDTEALIGLLESALADKSR